MGALDAIHPADCMIVAGTSLNVYPAASYVYEFHGKHRVILNLEPLDVPLDPAKDLFIQGPMREAFTALDAVLV